MRSLQTIHTHTPTTQPPTRTADRATTSRPTLSDPRLTSVAPSTTSRNPPSAYQNSPTRARGRLDSSNAGTSKNDCALCGRFASIGRPFRSRILGTPPPIGSRGGPPPDPAGTILPKTIPTIGRGLCSAPYSEVHTRCSRERGNQCFTVLVQPRSSSPSTAAPCSAPASSTPAPAA